MSFLAINGLRLQPRHNAYNFNIFTFVQCKEAREQGVCAWHSSSPKVTTSKMFQATKSQSTFETLNLMVGKSLYVSVLNIDCKIDSGYKCSGMVDVNSFVRKASNHYREPFLWFLSSYSYSPFFPFLDLTGTGTWPGACLSICLNGWAELIFQKNLTMTWKFE